MVGLACDRKRTTNRPSSRLSNRPHQQLIPSARYIPGRVQVESKQASDAVLTCCCLIPGQAPLLEAFTRSEEQVLVAFCSCSYWPFWSSILEKKAASADTTSAQSKGGIPGAQVLSQITVERPSEHHLRVALNRCGQQKLHDYDDAEGQNAL